MTARELCGFCVGVKCAWNASCQIQKLVRHRLYWDMRWTQAHTDRQDRQISLLRRVYGSYCGYFKHPKAYTCTPLQSLRSSKKP